jgi:hypothetical protein
MRSAQLIDSVLAELATLRSQRDHISEQHRSQRAALLMGDIGHDPTLA